MRYEGTWRFMSQMKILTNHTVAPLIDGIIPLGQINKQDCEAMSFSDVSFIQPASEREREKAEI